MNASKAIASIIDVAKAAAPMVPMGAAGLALGRAVLDLIDEYRETSAAAPEKIAEFDASREALEKAVNDHAARTAASLAD